VKHHHASGARKAKAENEDVEERERERKEKVTRKERERRGRQRTKERTAPNLYRAEANQPSTTITHKQRLSNILCPDNTVTRAADRHQCGARRSSSSLLCSSSFLAGE
jgi:hypothetical protein